ncbi:MAG: ferritin family protein [Planctomycetota bacterium]|jgi:rubrerythrin
MTILEYALQMEKDGETYYRKLVQQTTNKGIQAILTMLADEEVKHYNVIKRMQKTIPEMTETTILADAKNIFVQIKESAECFDFDIKETGLYKKARDIEERTRKFYLEKANEVESGRQSELFLQLAEQEKKHYFLLENIIEFISRPEQWLENAEFYHLEEF